MKSIIGTTLLLAAGAVLGNAATVVSGIPTEGLVYNWDFETGKDPVVGSGWGSEFGYTPGSGYGTVDSSTFKQPWVNPTGLNASSFSVSFDVANLTDSSLDGRSPLLTLYTNGGKTDQYLLDVETGERGAAGGYFVANGFGGVNESSGVSFGDDLSGSAWNTITITSDGTTLSIYINGVRKGALAGAENTAITGMQFGAQRGVGKKGPAFDIDNVCIWDQALTETEVQLLTGVIPEPSTFGLLAGLGALALVVSRRRRSRRN